MIVWAKEEILPGKLKPAQKPKKWNMNHTLKIEVVKNEVNVDMKAIKEAKWANELKVERWKMQQQQLQQQQQQIQQQQQ